MKATTTLLLPSPRLATLAACAIAPLILLLAVALPAAANTGQGDAKATQNNVAKKQRGHHRQRAKIRHRKQRRRQRRARARRLRIQRIQRRASRSLAVSANSAVSRPRVKTKAAIERSAGDGVLDAGFEDGLDNWNTAGVGESMPTVVNDAVRSGSFACQSILSGTQDRSELILGGNGGGGTDGMIEFAEGDEYWYGFSFNIVSMVYGHPGAHNLIMQFKGDDNGSPNFGLQLWDYEGDDGEYADNPKGLWSHGPSMDGDRFLAPVAEHAWHDVAIHFKASGDGNGFYELFLDGTLIDSRSGVSMIAPGASFAYIKDGIYRNGSEIPGISEIRLDSARLGHSASEVAAS